MLKNIILVALGGGIGSSLRYILSLAVQKNMGTAFPWGTLAVNILGSLLIGFLYGIADKGQFITSEWRLLLMVGICGGFTTFSAFAGEGYVLLKNGELFSLAIYSGLSLIFGILAVYLGYTISNLIR